MEEIYRKMDELSLNWISLARKLLQTAANREGIINIIMGSCGNIIIIIIIMRMIWCKQ
jgi:hypothetical protein